MGDLLSIAPGISSWTLTPTDLGLALTVERDDERQTLNIAVPREDTRRFAFGLLAASGDGFERTFTPAMPARPDPKRPPSEPDPAPAAPDDPPPIAPAGSTALAREKGFTGDVCEQCGKARMLRAGKCLTCQDCFATTGCS